MPPDKWDPLTLLNLVMILSNFHHLKRCIDLFLIHLGKFKWAIKKLLLLQKTLHQKNLPTSYNIITLTFMLEVNVGEWCSSMLMRLIMMFVLYNLIGLISKPISPTTDLAYQLWWHPMENQCLNQRLSLEQLEECTAIIQLILNKLSSVISLLILMLMLFSIASTSPCLSRYLAVVKKKKCKRLFKKLLLYTGPLSIKRLNLI